MRIGVDIDGVLTDVGGYQKKYGIEFCEKRDLEGIINPKAYKMHDVFGTTKDVGDAFWSEYVEHYAEHWPIRPDAPEMIQKLKEEDHEIYIISARFFAADDTPRGENMRILVEEWLRRNDVLYDELIFSSEDKRDICKAKQIEIMVEDAPTNVAELSEIIPIFCYHEDYNEHLENPNIIRCYSWLDIYDKITNYMKVRNEA